MDADETNLAGAAESPRTWHLRTLNGFALAGVDGDIRLQPAAQRLLAVLAVHDGAVERTYLAGVMWIDTSDRKAAASLRSLLWRLRQRYQDLINVTSTHVGLTDDVDVDLRRSRTCARALIEDRQPPDALHIELLAADLLPDWYDDWVIVEREVMRQRRLHALEALCVGFASQGEFALALEAGLQAVAAEPLRESAHRAVVAAHIAEGNAVEALRQYETYACLLDKELRLCPSDRMQALIASLNAKRRPP